MKNSVHDMAIRIKNGYMTGKPAVIVTFSKLNEKILDILKRNEYITDYSVAEKDAKKLINVDLRYENSEPAITNIKLGSTPGKRIYSRSTVLKPVLGGLGMAILTTSKGVITDKEARKLHAGGEVLFTIW